jgi:hypothetical protein
VPSDDWSVPACQASLGVGTVFKRLVTSCTAPKGPGPEKANDFPPSLGRVALSRLNREKLRGRLTGTAEASAVDVCDPAMPPAA